ncbi:DUF4177 domain-containing protein [Fretibacter rubidus]|uniref:DUF4177 domain-containing protein n=1 Tax=Fretibacter rubidus TaxID=570162 RepID=UPI00352A6EA5
MQNRKWNYKVETIKAGIFFSQEKQDAVIEERLNRLGMEGWEFVQLIHGYGTYPRVVLRR